MWIADISDVNSVIGAMDRQRLPLRCLCRRRLLAAKCNLAHIDSDLLCAFADLTGDDSADCIDGERLCTNLIAVV